MATTWSNARNWMSNFYEENKQSIIIIAIAIVTTAVIAFIFVSRLPLWKDLVLSLGSIAIVSGIVASRREGNVADLDPEDIVVPAGLAKKRLRNDEHIVARGRLNAGKLSHPVIVLISCTIGIMYVHSEQPLVWRLIAIVLCAVLIIQPVVTRILPGVKQIQMKYVIVTMAVLLLVTLLVKELVPAILAAVLDAVWGVLSFIGPDPIRIMMTIWLFGAFFFIVRFAEWAQGQVFITNERIFIKERFFFPIYPAMSLGSISDDTQQYGFIERLFNCVKVVLESPGQNQALTVISWLPVKFLRFL